MFVRRIPTQAERNIFSDMIRRGRTEQGLVRERPASVSGCSLPWSGGTGQGKCGPDGKDSHRLAAVIETNPIIFAEEAGRMYQFRPVKQFLTSPELGNYSSYAICAFAVTPGRCEEVCSVSDVSCDWAFAAVLADKCTRLQLDPVHLRDVILDALP